MHTFSFWILHMCNFEGSSLNTRLQDISIPGAWWYYHALLCCFYIKLVDIGTAFHISPNCVVLPLPICQPREYTTAMKLVHINIHTIKIASQECSIYSIFLARDIRGTMFIDCSSWKSSLQAYGIFRDEIWPDDLQKLHLQGQNVMMDNHNVVHY